MIYGANGYTGRLIAEEARQRGMQPVLAGRNAEALEQMGHELGRFTEEVKARMPQPDESQALALSGGVPIIHLIRTAFDTNGLPVEVCDTVMAADSFVLSYELPAT